MDPPEERSDPPSASRSGTDGGTTSPEERAMARAKIEEDNSAEPGEKPALCSTRVKWLCFGALVVGAVAVVGALVIVCTGGGCGAGDAPSTVKLFGRVYLSTTKSLNFYDNFTGTLPTELALLTELNDLYLGHNNISGTIPSEFGLLTELNNLHLSYSKLTGTIPTELGLLTALTSLELRQNNLTGIPTELGLLTALLYLHLQDNNLIGTIPTELGLMTEMVYFWLRRNTLTGTIPTELGLMTDMFAFILNDNTLTGTIPTELGLMTLLDRLVLSENNIGGSVPSSLCLLVGASLEIDCGQVLCPDFKCNCRGRSSAGGYVDCPV